MDTRVIEGESWPASCAGDRAMYRVGWKRLDFRKQNMLKVRIGGLKGPVSRISNGKNSNILYF